MKMEQRMGFKHQPLGRKGNYILEIRILGTTNVIFLMLVEQL